MGAYTDSNTLRIILMNVNLGNWQMFKWLREHGLFGYNPWYLLRHPWIVVHESWLRIKWFCQRGWRGYADCDAWGVCDYLCEWMPEVIERYMGGPGHPCDVTYDEWQLILRNMATGFRAGKRISEGDYPREEHEILMARFEHGMALFHKHFWGLWD